MKLMIVESPTKAKKIADILGAEYRVVPSLGHIRDLPLGDLAESVHIEGDSVSATYVTIAKSADALKRIKQLAKEAEVIYLASDPDREGEAIAWHLEQVLGKKKPYHRVTFQAITPEAVRKGIQSARKIDYNLVNAQETRRILDRCVGWIVSPMIKAGLKQDGPASAGRVQSVGLRFVVDREREIQNFRKRTYFVLAGTFEARPTQPKFTADIESYEGVPVGTTWSDRPKADNVAVRCRQALYRVIKIDREEKTENPPAPFITSSVQNVAVQQLGFAPKRTMELLQSLFEDGKITYHRTDSPFIVPEAIEGARVWIKANLPADYLPAKPFSYAAKGGAQEAHEGIRPTHWETGPGDEGSDAERLYGLIWRRFIGSQVAPARNQVTALRLGADDRGGSRFAVFLAKGRMRLFDGWRRIAALDETATAEEGEDRTDKLLPTMSENDPATLLDLKCDERATKPPPRFTQGSLITALERNGIGRPSSYATILDKIFERAYIREEKKKLHATEQGMAVCEFLCQKFAGDFMEFDFTKRIEAQLDVIADGKLQWQPFLAGAVRELSAKAQKGGLARDPLAKRTIALIPGKECPTCGAGMTEIKGTSKGRDYHFYSCMKYPKCKGTLQA